MASGDRRIARRRPSVYPLRIAGDPREGRLTVYPAGMSTLDGRHAVAPTAPDAATARAEPPRRTVAGGAWARPLVGLVEWTMSRRRRLMTEAEVAGDPTHWFEPDGLDRAAKVCARANRDLLAWMHPPRPENVRPRAVREHDLPPTAGLETRGFTFDSPLPSGDAANDRVEVRVFRGPEAATDRSVLFHHPIYQGVWNTWAWFLERIARRIPVAVMASPWHFERAGGTPHGSRTLNPNPARLFCAMRQWSHDLTTTRTVLRERAGLEAVAEIGFSFGAYQSLLVGAATRHRMPIVTIACTNRYAWGLQFGILGRAVVEAMERAGIDRARLYELVDSLQLERHMAPLRGAPTMMVRGLHDHVDPPPSLERLEHALAPRRALHLPAGHATVVAWRTPIMREVDAFLLECGV